ncbi:hypothetical protein Dimus_014321 [Dionaea muscipula]
MAQAECFVCRHWHKACDEDCFFRAYFGAYDLSAFLAVNEVYGKANFIKFVTKLEGETLRRHAVDTMVKEAISRIRNREFGISATIREQQIRIQVLEARIQELENELNLLKFQNIIPPSSPLPELPLPEFTNTSDVVDSLSTTP